MNSPYILRKGRDMKQSTFKGDVLPYILLLPTFIILVVFLFYPAVETFRLSLYKIHPFTGAGRFAGLYNFKKILPTLNTCKVLVCLLSLLWQ